MVEERTAPGRCSYQAGTSVPPPVKLIRSGDFARMISHCSFLLGFNAFSFRARITSGIAVSSQRESPIGFDKFRNSDIQAATRFETCLAQPLVRNDVIPLVRILAYLG